jgi:hypothetical protein
VNEKEKYTVIFEEILSRAQAERKLEPSIKVTAEVLVSASYFDEHAEIVQEARKKLTKEEPRSLYFECIKDLVDSVREERKWKKYIWANQLGDLGLQGLGIKIDDLSWRGVNSKDIFRGEPDWEAIRSHINENVLGDFFIEKLSVPPDTELWGEEFPLRTSACDASQHRFKLRTPFNVNFSSPVVINNSAGVLKERGIERSKWEHIIVPKGTQDFEDWVVVGFKDYTELSENDYEWSTKSAMDVGQFYVEETYIFPYGGLKFKPDIHFRDGRIFPQDHAMNCKLQNRHGELTREAIYRMTTALKKAEELGITFCGVAKHVNLKIYSSIIDWYIRKKMGVENWNMTGHILSDTEVMRRILCNENFEASTFNEIYVTCPIARSFYTTSNLNRRTEKQVVNDLNSLNNIYHSRNLTARSIVNEALEYKVAMFFAGHSKSPEVYFPRYEFVFHDKEDHMEENIVKILSALRLASLDMDVDHLWGLEEPINTMIPTPLLIAHNLSKKVGEELVTDWVSKVNAEFIRLKNQQSKSRSF